MFIKEIRLNPSERRSFAHVARYGMFISMLSLVGCAAPGPMLVFTQPGSGMVSSNDIAVGVSVGTQVAGSGGGVMGGALAGLAGILLSSGNSVAVPVWSPGLGGRVCSSDTYLVKPAKVLGTISPLRWYIVSKDGEGDWVFEEAPARLYQTVARDICYPQYAQFRKAFPQFRGGALDLK
jgi:hypothetical protein